MISEMDELIQKINKKPSWGQKEVISMIRTYGEQMTSRMDDGNFTVIKGSKKTSVNELKKYDVLYLPLLGSPHYFIIHKIKDDVVYGVNITTNGKPNHVTKKIEKDRFFLGSNSYASNTYMSVPIEEALKCFVRVYENKKEADEIFNLVKSHYKTMFNFK